jgi:dynein heavy chain
VVDYSKDERVMYMCNALTSLDEFSMERMDQDKYRRFNDFLENPQYTKFFVWLEHANNYVVRTSFDGAPAFFDAGIKAEEYQVCFYFKRCGNDPIVPALIETQLLVGQIDGNPLDDLLNKMNAEYVPKLLGENDWPDGVRKEFQANLNKFMATITEESQKDKGRTYLYIPEETITDVDTAVKDKDLLQRLESTVIYWTRQIKELVSN